MHISQDSMNSLAIGLGAGFGIGIIAWHFYKEKSNQNQELAVSIGKLIAEVKELKETLILLQKATDSASGGTTSKKSKSKQFQKSDDDDDDDDEFFDISQVDGINKSKLQGESLEELNLALEKADELRNGSSEDKEENHNILLKLSKEFPLDCEVLWRLCRAQYDMAMLCGKSDDKEGKLDFMRKGIESGKQALDINDQVPSAHKWYAINIGNYSSFCGSQEQIELGYKYKQHIEKAIELDPHDPSGYSLLARWCYEVYMLPWYLRKVAAAIFADPPSSTIEEALKYAMKAEELKPHFWKENTLLIAKCYYQMSNYGKAKEWLLTANDLPSKDEDDRLAQKEIEELLAKV
eukprot:gene20271-22256_t